MLVLFLVVGAFQCLGKQLNKLPEGARTKLRVDSSHIYVFIPCGRLPRPSGFCQFHMHDAFIANNKVDVDDSNENCACRANILRLKRAQVLANR